MYRTSGERITTLQGPKLGYATAAFSPDGTRIAIGSGRHSAVFLYSKVGEPAGALYGHTGVIYALEFSPDGNLLSSGSADGTARLWDLKSRESIAALRGHDGPVSSVTFSPDGRHILTASQDRTARVWRIDGELTAILGGHEQRLRVAEFSPEGDRIVTLADGGIPRVWLAKTDDLIAVADRRLTRPLGPSELMKYGAFLGEDSLHLTAKRLLDELLGKFGEEELLSHLRSAPDIDPGVRRIAELLLSGR